MTTVIATLFVLGIMIFVHELGHFLIAKWVGIRVERFSLGFPPKLIGKTIGDTEYCISWVPLGGYVKMAGEIPDAEHVTGAPDEFMSKTIGQRTAVIIAGPLANALTALVICWAMFFFQGKPVLDPDNIIVGGVVEDGPAARAGIESGDIILKVNDLAVSQFAEMAEAIHNHPGDSVLLTWLHEGRETSAWIVALDTVVLNEAGEEVRRGLIGIGEGYQLVPAGFFESMRLGAERTWIFAEGIFKFLYGLVSGSVSAKMIGGPVFIARVAGDAARQGFGSLLWLVAFLSVNLAIVNVLPIPVLDGGHLMFLGIEKLKGNPLSLKQRAIAQQVGLFFILIFISYVTFNDFLR
jgi:regulator of sigma E protease